MLETMYVRCTHCGYDNSPEYRFCGMCGGSLPHPTTETKPPVRDVAPLTRQPAEPTPAVRSGNGDENVHGPSFLGLSEDPKVEFSYLYEEEPTRSHAGLVAILILLIAGGGYLGWQWRHNGFPFNRLNASSSPVSPAAPSPDTSQNQTTQAEKPATEPGDVLPTAPDQKAPGTAAAPSAAGSAETNAPAPSNAAPAAEPAKKAEATQPASPTKPRAKLQPASHAPAKSPGVETAALATSPDADLELAGERYLYGTGLPQNCARAESSLRTAAMHGNSKAETVLGTMYATGHCVGRDLPAAYRWFARALHQEPQNSRISADLQVLWRQMTPSEQQVATAKQ